MKGRGEIKTTKDTKSTKMEFDYLCNPVFSFLKLAEIKIGLLMNFNVTKLKDGIKRFCTLISFVLFVSIG
jgi:hypothetical protein